MCIRLMFFSGACAVLAATVSVTRADAFGGYYALITAAGAVSSSAGVNSATRTAVGTYSVTFNSPVSACGFVAAVTGANTGFATANRVSSTQIDVLTFDSTGTAANRQFNLLVLCAP